MSLKKTITQHGRKLLSDPRVLKLMQDERVMKMMMSAMAVPGKVQSFTDEQKEAFARSLGLITEKEYRDLERKVKALEIQLGELKAGK